jgi:hypothetical protein
LDQLILPRVAAQTTAKQLTTLQASDLATPKRNDVQFVFLDLSAELREDGGESNQKSRNSVARPGRNRKREKAYLVTNSELGRSNTKFGGISPIAAQLVCSSEDSLTNVHIT